MAISTTGKQAKPSTVEQEKPVKEPVVPPAEQKAPILEWFSIFRLGDNDYRIVKQEAPLQLDAKYGPPMRLPVEVWDRWQIEAEEMLSRKIAEW